MGGKQVDHFSVHQTSILEAYVWHSERGVIVLLQGEAISGHSGQMEKCTWVTEQKQ